MAADLYPDANTDIRGDILDEQARAWAHIASPGAWFSGADRIAIAAETRLAKRYAPRRELARPEYRRGCPYLRPDKGLPP